MCNAHSRNAGNRARELNPVKYIIHTSGADDLSGPRTARYAGAPRCSISDVHIITSELTPASLKRDTECCRLSKERSPT